MKELVKKIKQNYDSIDLYVPIKTRKRSLGEIDVVARRGDKIDIYEVKCSHRIIKARKQLQKISKYIINTKIGNYYFYCGSSRLIVLI
ncbi:MAG: hypothetical protein QXG00_02980 [Candidatus Woesearchaeota archaeon]